VATARGIKVSESRQEVSPVYESLIRISLRGAGAERIFAGTLVAGAPRIVEVKGMELDAPFAGTMLYINNLDKPGFIGALGALLGDAGVNIATFNLGRTAAGGDAIALVGVDQIIGEDILGKVRALPHVKEARSLSF
jgi:D-3-phosphoglycerate dehydrogenase